MFLYILGFISYNFDIALICFICISFWRSITHINSIIDEHNCDKLLKYIIKNSKYIQSHSINLNEKIPLGLCFNKRFIAFIKSETISNQRKTKVEYFITFIGKLPEEIKINKPIENTSSNSNKKDSISVMMRQASYYDSKFIITPQKFNYKPTKKQIKIIKNKTIINKY